MSRPHLIMLHPTEGRIDLTDLMALADMKQHLLIAAFRRSHGKKMFSPRRGLLQDLFHGKLRALVEAYTPESSNDVEAPSQKRPSDEAPPTPAKQAKQEPSTSESWDDVEKQELDKMLTEIQKPESEDLEKLDEDWFNSFFDKDNNMI